MPEDRPDLQQLFVVVQESLAGLADHVAEAGQFELRVLGHALEIMAREAKLGAGVEANDRLGLARLLDQSGSQKALNQALCEAIRNGSRPAEDPAVLAHLRADVSARLSIDNPEFDRVYAPMR